MQLHWRALPLLLLLLLLTLQLGCGGRHAALVTSSLPHTQLPQRCSNCSGRGDMLSALAFGAVGDGRHDDGPALQHAIDAAQRSARTLWLPAGRYVVSAPLLVRAFRHDVRNSHYKPLRLLG